MQLSDPIWAVEAPLEPEPAVLLEEDAAAAQDSASAPTHVLLAGSGSSGGGGGGAQGRRRSQSSGQRVLEALHQMRRSGVSSAGTSGAGNSVASSSENTNSSLGPWEGQQRRARMSQELLRLAAEDRKSVV